MISNLTAMIIQGNDVIVDPLERDGQWGWMIRKDEGPLGRYRPILSCPCVHPDETTALKDANDLIVEIRGSSCVAEEVAALLGSTDMTAVQAVVDSAKLGGDQPG